MSWALCKKLELVLTVVGEFLAEIFGLDGATIFCRNRFDVLVDEETLSTLERASRKILAISSCGAVFSAMVNKELQKALLAWVLPVLFCNQLKFHVMDAEMVPWIRVAPHGYVLRLVDMYCASRIRVAPHGYVSRLMDTCCLPQIHACFASRIRVLPPWKRK